MVTYDVCLGQEFTGPGKVPLTGDSLDPPGNGSAVDCGFYLNLKAPC